MRVQSVTPIASSLLESLRAIGYSVDTSLADLIDNSIAASSTMVDITFQDSRIGAPYVAILDDGNGMDENGLVEAMRHGSRHPDERRADRDLGRFGLGLKTASQSQCRVLTVISKTSKDAPIIGARWDLDFIRMNEGWPLQLLSEQDVLDSNFAVPEQEIQKLINSDHGTLVLWQKLDRLTAELSNNDKEALTERLNQCDRHLGLVFHRFISGHTPRLRIHMNGRPLHPIDPFRESHSNNWTIDSGSLPVKNAQGEQSNVLIETHVLPTQGRLSAKDVATLCGVDGLRKGQGFYVYRAERLVVWGTWFRLCAQSEMSKLARVKVDIPNTLDQDWSLDIRKSTAHPPAAIRELLRPFIERLIDRSMRVQTYRGRTQLPREGALWLQTTVDATTFRFSANRFHYGLLALNQQLNEMQCSMLENYLKSLDDAIPYNLIHSLMASDNSGQSIEANARSFPDYWIELGKDIVRTLVAQHGKSKADAISMLSIIEPFASAPEATNSLKKVLTQCSTT
jgi:hypothetical protein